MKRRAGAATLGVLGVAVLVAWLWGDTPAVVPEPPPPPSKPGPRLSEPGPAPASPMPAPEPELSPEPPSAEASAAPIIDEVIVEKSEVCEGEENLITVRAHTPDGKDEFLHYMVDGKQGQQVPLRSFLEDENESEPRPREVRVFGRGNTVTVAPIPPFVVKKCRLPLVAWVNTRLRANTWSEFELEVKLIEKTSSESMVGDFEPRSYEWSFGDGETAITQVPYVTHNYEGRKQDSQFSNFLVQVKVYGVTDEPVVGRTSLQLVNPAFEDLAYKGVVTLMLQLTPRFPELGDDGVVRQKVRLFHNRDRPVFIHNAVVFKHRTAPTEPVAPKPMDPSSLLGTSVIPPGRGVEFEVRLDTRAEQDVFSEEYSLEGKDSQGLPVRGAFSVMRPPPKPTKENSNPVVDPLFKEKILAARKILNRPYVTDEDIWRLQREGRFAELEARFRAEPAPQPLADGHEAPKAPTEPPPPGPTSTPDTVDDRTAEPSNKPPSR